MNNLILNFKNITKKDLPLVGWKWANLWEMTNAWFPIPQGFCITIEAYKTFISQTNEIEKLLSTLEKIPTQNTEEIKNISQKIRKTIKSHTIQDSIKQQILKTRKEIWTQKTYAIRSSATAEDLPSASFAGQQDTFLNIIWEEKLLKSIKNCWASLFTDRAVLYRNQNNFSHRTVFISVVIQEMINSEISGIMFTADPITSKRKTTYITSSYGLWEALVSWIVSPDSFKVFDWKITEKNLSKKEIQIISDKNWWTKQTKIPEEKQLTQSLSDKQILKLAQIWEKIEKHYNLEQDIEWCYADNKFYIVQTRPITTLYPLPENITPWLHLYGSIWHVQMMTEAMKPLWLSMFLNFSNYVEKFFEMKTPFISSAWSRIYIDLIHLLKYKVFKNHLLKFLEVTDTNIAKIVKTFLETEQFKKIKLKNISFRKKRKLFIFWLWICSKFFFSKFDNIFNPINNSIKEIIKETKEELENTPRNQKIQKIKSIVPKFPKFVFKTKIINHMPLAIWSYKILWHLSKKWLWDIKEIDAIWKAPEWNITTAMSLDLWDLADLIREKTEIVKYFETFKKDNTIFQEKEATKFWKWLEGIDKWKEIIKPLENFFEKYGMRCTNEIDLTHPRWKEQPTQVITLILNNVKNFKKWQHREEFITLKKDSEKAVEQFLTRIKKTKFWFLKSILLKRIIFVYRKNIWIREHPKYFIINMFGVIKDTIISEAKELIKEWILKNTEDLYYFTLDEIDQIIQKRTIDSKLLKQRKIKYNQDKKLKPPRIFTEMWEILIPKPDKDLPEWIIIWTPASSWTVIWTARVIKKLEEANLKKWEILVTAYTDPAWTTLFWIASAVITEVWWQLTHWAVVAREYGIPAVVWVDNATTLIKDWDKIKVNWDEGYIEILS